MNLFRSIGVHRQTVAVWVNRRMSHRDKNWSKKPHGHKGHHSVTHRKAITLLSSSPPRSAASGKGAWATVTTGHGASFWFSAFWTWGVWMALGGTCGPHFLWPHLWHTHKHTHAHTVLFTASCCLPPVYIWDPRSGQFLSPWNGSPILSAFPSAALLWEYYRLNLIVSFMWPPPYKGAETVGSESHGKWACERQCASVVHCCNSSS